MTQLKIPPVIPYENYGRIIPRKIWSLCPDGFEFASYETVFLWKYRPKLGVPSGNITVKHHFLNGAYIPSYIPANTPLIIPHIPHIPL